MESALITHPHFQPFLTLNELIRSGLTVPHHRNWIGRTPNKKGQLKVTPIAHSFDWCKTLLQAVLSIDANEEDWSLANNQPRRFPPIMDKEELLAIGYQWERYHDVSWASAVQIWESVYNDAHSRLSEEDMQRIISANKAAQVPLNQMKEQGYIQLMEIPEFGLMDAFGDIAGLYEGQSVVDSKGCMNSPVDHTSSFSVNLGNDPDLSWWWITEVAGGSNPGMHFLTRNGYISFKSGYQKELTKILSVKLAIEDCGFSAHDHSNLKTIVESECFISLDQQYDLFANVTTG